MLHNRRVAQASAKSEKPMMKESTQGPQGLLELEKVIAFAKTC